MQNFIDLGEPRQHDMAFPVSLAEKYQPPIGEFVGLREAQRVMLGLLETPKPCNLLFIGDPGCGKTSMAMKFCEQLPAAHHHIRAQSADVVTLDRIWELCQYSPARGKFHVVHIDEIDGATDKAQLQLLSRMDGTSRLKPVFGGGFEKGEVPPIIYIFTCNPRRVRGQMQPPPELLPRFLSRCIAVYFDRPEVKTLAKYLAKIWKAEGQKPLPSEYLAHLASDCIGVRDALMRLDSELVAPRSAADIRRILSDAKARAKAAKTESARQIKILTAQRLDADVAENICGHPDAPHHSRGLCKPCYRLFRSGQLASRVLSSMTAHNELAN